MNIKRILMFHSFNDAGYASRVESISNNPDMDEYNFYHCCVVDHDRDSWGVDELDRLAEADEETKPLLSELVKEEMGPILEKAIEEFLPDIVIVHNGTIFNAVPGACMVTFEKLLEKFPTVRFVLEDKSGWLLRTTGKNHSSFKRRTIESQIKWVKEYFVNDEEADKIVESIFS